MTDDTTATEKPLFTMTPTSDAYMQLAGQVADLADDVAELQAAQPATGDHVAEIDPEDLGVLEGRINRHRAEIEEIKRRYNALIRYLDSGAALPVSQPAENTIQPRNMIQ